MYLFSLIFIAILVVFIVGHIFCYKFTSIEILKDLCAFGITFEILLIVTIFLSNLVDILGG